MKHKKIMKKITLNKKTISNLSETDLNKVKGQGKYSDDDLTCLYITCGCTPDCCTGNPCKSEP